jgi:hypothetical protein
VTKNKKPRSSFSPDESKNPRVASDPTGYYQHQPSWRLNKLELCDPFGWHEVDRDTIDRIRKRLVDLESMTWREILVDGRKQHHSVKIGDLCPEAQRRLEAIGLDDVDRLLSLRLSATERIWGLFTQGIFNLLWWDPEHKICPSIVKDN